MCWRPQIEAPSGTESQAKPLPSHAPPTPFDGNIVGTIRGRSLRPQCAEAAIRNRAILSGRFQLSSEATPSTPPRETLRRCFPQNRKQPAQAKRLGFFFAGFATDGIRPSPAELGIRPLHLSTTSTTGHPDFQLSGMMARVAFPPILRSPSKSEVNQLFPSFTRIPA